ncbi:elongation factor P maturation arginine rhamnosyltransferase EarP [Rhodocyclus tenuis]|uniref:elongation factor P maturation arginine rhamnosyltransferase EarP n=1 Tax=Rhodocyclus tenuis TaxID=1066 RepID=UPI0019030194|nr:elongation factor P maturation arginine rhamnosyltransferase EarP [Rhodocyclus tenuis]MBK1678889.1 hypothetical protein [Rhodocyclus tenuis]
MPTPAPPRAERWDIFCAVIDNFGDIGVSWRLARQLAAEHGVAVRLWVDEPAALAALCPQFDPKKAGQTIHGVAIHHWRRDAAEDGGDCADSLQPFLAAPGEVVIEAFGCNIPESGLAAMAQRQPPPVWINLEYLSAEPWTLGCHGLGSPHPRLPLTRHFFFPGFVPETGGLLREVDLPIGRQAAAFGAADRAALWRDLGMAPPPADALLVSLFSYENAAIAELFAVWVTGDAPVCCLLPVSRALPTAAAFFGQTLVAGDCVRRGALELRVLPFVEQTRYDALLRACDLNFVRGEDSFVRAQWAARPLVWHIYAQEDAAHLVKLDAFLDLYCAALTPPAAAAVRDFAHAWNGGHIAADIWQNLRKALPELATHATQWCDELAKQQDLASALVHFCQARV